MNSVAIVLPGGFVVSSSTAGKVAVPLAAGENVAGEAAFDRAIGAGALAVLQPDLAKWGGISGCWPVIQRAMAAGLRFCPHYLGGGIGLLHSAHVLAAAGGDGMLEIDSNPNPLRSLVATALESPQDGWISLGEAPGIGGAPDLDALRALGGDGVAARGGPFGREHAHER